MSGACAAAGIRCTEDSLNYGFGGALVGSFIGLRAKSIHAVVTHSVGLFAAGAACDYIPKTLFSAPSEQARNEQVQNYHKSISSTTANS